MLEPRSWRCTRGWLKRFERLLWLAVGLGLTEGRASAAVEVSDIVGFGLLTVLEIAEDDHGIRQDHGHYGIIAAHDPSVGENANQWSKLDTDTSCSMRAWW